MNWNDIQTHWNTYKQDAKKIWPRLQDAELDGDRTKLIDKLRDAHNLPQKEAETQVDTWAESLETT